MEPKKAVEKILGGITEIEEDKYRFGHTKVFFRAGVIGALEDLRDDTIGKCIIRVQTECRAKLSREKYMRTINERNGAIVIQQNWRAFTILKDWPWQSLLFKIKPLLDTAEKRKEMDELLTEYDEMKKQLEIETKERKRLESERSKLIQLKNKLISTFEGLLNFVKKFRKIFEASKG